MGETFPLLARMKDLPSPFDERRVARAFETLEEEGAAALLDDPRAKRLLAAVFGNSPYLTRTILREPSMLARLLADEPEGMLAAILAAVEAAARESADLSQLMRRLRRAKRDAAVVIALADIAGAWALAEVTDALTRLADACVEAAVRFLLEAEVRAQRLQIQNVETSGFIVLAMGKFGAGELNYSSDIDLIVFFDADRFKVAPGEDAQMIAVKVTRGLVRAMSEQTEDGYVFRTDLRLRPDAGATQVALSTEAAEIYYESMGQNWERAAMIKARACAGDITAGGAFLETLKPYIWRKYLDFAAIEDIHSIKRQIHAYKGHGTIAVAGHNIKLGRGGIREIEFFVQTQQLILGGRDPSLRGRTTCGMLDQLARLGLIEDAAAAALKSAYVFLRTVEHRLQMIEDMQTHTLPKMPEELDHVACFCGFATTAAFEARLISVLSAVQTHYARLFEAAPPLAEERGSLVFTGVEEDPETLETLMRMGFARAKEVSALIRGWHHGRLRATRSARARELLTKLVPVLLAALARTGDPDGAFMRFHTFLEGLSAGVQLFSLLTANPSLLDVLAQALGTAPRLAAYLSHNAQVVDALLDPDFGERLPAPPELENYLARVLSEARDYQDMLDATRRFAREETFRVGFQILNGVADAPSAGIAFTNVAETVIRGLLHPTIDNLAERHGHMTRGALAVLAMGKLGGHEMSAASDLDLIFIYDAPEDARSKSKRPLSPSEYYARLAQRMVNALTVPTAEGKLYEVDMQLRPSGNAGPVATRLSSFETYQRETAWTWEHMALTRARAIAGDAALSARVGDIIRAVLTRRRDQAIIAADVIAMRKKMKDAYPSQDPWELKHVRGGLVDLEFIVQYLQIIHAHEQPEILCPNTRAAIAALGRAGALPPSAVHALDRTGQLLHTVLQVLRVAVEGAFKPSEAAPGLARLLCRATDCPSMTVLERTLIEAEREVFALFGAIIEQAAQ